MNDRYDNLLEKAIQSCCDQIAADLERKIYDMYTRNVCVVCRKPYHDWEDGDAPNNHPFCKNNLEYLEWESKRREL